MYIDLCPCLFHGISRKEKLLWQAANRRLLQFTLKTLSWLYKDENIREEINYKDKFLTIRKYKEIEKVTQSYIYLGKVDTHPNSAEGEKKITMIFALENELPQDLFEDFMTDEKFIEIEDNK